MMDQNFLNSVLASNGSGAATEAKSKESRVDAEAFSSAMSDAEKPAGGKGKAAAKKADADEAKAERKKEERTRQEAADEHKARTQDAGAAARMQKLMHKNVDTLSLAEKQALRVAEFASEAMQMPKAQAPLPGGAAGVAPQMKAGSASPKGQRVAEAAAGKLEGAAARVDREKTEDRKAKADEASREMGRGAAPNLEQAMTRESRFTEELQKSQATERQHERQHLIDQILSQVEVRNLASRTELSLKLNPEYLGDLRIKLTHGENGVRAEFESSSRNTRELLREGEEELRTQAAAKGVRLGPMRFMVVERGGASTSA